MKFIEWILSLLGKRPLKPPVVKELIKENTMLDIEEKLSPNRSSRKGRSPKFIVIHWTGGRFSPSVNWMCDPDAKVSAHYCISKEGAIVRLVPEEEKAWHAGKCEKYPYYANKDSIGIELEGPPSTLGITSWWATQLKPCIELCKEISERYPGIKITDHSSLTPSRKVDVKQGAGPNTFPWDWFLEETGLEELDLR